VKLVVSRAAAADIERLRAFLREKNPTAAERAASELIDAIDSLANMPDRGRPSGIPGVRELIVPFGHEAYVVRYAHLPDESETTILRIWHSRENR